MASFDKDLGWLPVPDPPVTGALSFVMVQLDPNNLLLVGGRGRSGTVADTAIYSVRANAWFPGGALAVPRQSALAAPLGDGGALVVGGADTGPANSAEVFNPTTGWHSATALGGTGKPYQLVALGPGKVLALIGGEQPATATYDASTNAWTLGPGQPNRSFGPAVVLPDGRVMVVGGQSAGVSPVRPSAAVDLYDPASSGWSSIQALSQPRAGHTVTALAGGVVLVAGGITRVEAGSRPAAVNSAEVFGGSSVAARAARIPTRSRSGVGSAPGSCSSPVAWRRCSASAEPGGQAGW